MVLARQIKTPAAKGYAAGAFLMAFLSVSFSGTAEATFTVAQEAEKMLHLRCGREVLFHFFDGFRELHTGAENDAIGLLEEALAFRRNAISGESDAVQPYDAGRIAICDDIRADVLHDLGHAADHSTGANLDELVKAAHAADDGMVFDSDMACRAREGGHDDVVAEATVMCDVGIGLQHIVRADACLAVFPGRSVNGDVFTEKIVIADDDGAVFVCEFQILRVFSNDRMRINVILFAHADILRDDSVRPDDGAFADLAVFSDIGISADDDILVNDRTRMNHGRRMDIRCLIFQDFEFHCSFPFMTACTDLLIA